MCINSVKNLEYMEGMHLFVFGIEEVGEALLDEIESGVDRFDTLTRLKLKRNEFGAKIRAEKISKAQVRSGHITYLKERVGAEILKMDS